MKFFYVYYNAHTIYHLIALRGLIVGQQRQVTRYAQILLRIVGRIFADDLVPFCIFARFSEQKKKTGLFLFVNAIAFTESVTEDVSVTFTTSISRFLGSDFNLYYGDVSVSLWDFCNPRLNTGTIEQTVSIYLVAFAWVVLIGCLLSALFYILYLCKIRLYWLSGFATRMTTIGSIFILLSLILGQISFDGITIYAEGVSYGVVIPILYSIVMGGLCIVVSYLLKYSQKRRGILKEMLVKQEMEAAVGMQALCASSNAAQAPYTANGVIQTP